MLNSFFKDRLYLGINIVGLSIAMTVCLVLGLYLRTELTYDQHHVRHDNIYRVANEFTASGRSEQMATSSFLLGPTLIANFPEVKAFVRFRTPGYWETGSGRLIKHGEDKLYWENVYLADANVFDVFTHQILYGDAATALREPTSAAVSETFARKYFGNANPLGEVLTLDNGQQWHITLVFADLPANSHLKYDVLFSYNSLPPLKDARERQIEFFGASDYTYVVMPDNYDVRNFDGIARQIYQQFMAERAAEIHVDNWNAWLQPLPDVHLHSELTNDLPTGNLSYLLGLEAVTFFILLIACVNYINLATARAARRAREIGIRKILGGGRSALMLRFVSEAMALSLLALVVSLLLMETVVPLTGIAQWLGQASILGEWQHADVLAVMIGFSLLIGLLSGLYPAFYLSSLPVSHALHTGASKLKSGVRLRQLLVVAQFSISIAVLSCVFIMQSQMQFLVDQPLGFDKQNKLMVTLHGVDVLDQMPVIKRELVSTGSVRKVSSSDTMLGLDVPVGFMDAETNDGTMEGVLVRHLPVAANFIDVAGIQLVKGRDFSPDIATDAGQTMIVNEALVHHMGWTDPIGKRMGLRGRKVIGVVRDFNFQSLHVPIGPLIIYQNSANFQYVAAEERAFKLQYLLLDVAPGNLTGTLDFIRTTIARFDPVHPLDYRFISDAMNTRYKNEDNVLRLTGAFAGICILIACLGLFGLVTFTTAQRTKEIGIRKVLGSSVWNIVLLLTNDFSKLVLLANLIGWPMAYFAMSRWLQNFAYHIDLTPLIFVGSGLIALCIAWVTVGGIAAKAASQKPVLALRYE